MVWVQRPSGQLQWRQAHVLFKSGYLDKGRESSVQANIDYSSNLSDKYFMCIWNEGRGVNVLISPC